MPTVIAIHDVTDTARWLSSPKREDIFGPIGLTNIRTFANPQNRNSVALIKDVPDMDAMMAMLESDERKAAAEHDGVADRRRPSRSSARSRTGLSAGPESRRGATSAPPQG